MIKLLDKATIDKIAAGEVIERPYSVVKELLENSIDAGSSSITVEIKEGGMSLIRVTDNGCGISKDEVKTAYMRHATSKISTAKDLESIASLGFRGEALSTIAAVSQTEMITKQADSLIGVKYVIHGGNEIEFSEVGVPNGTTVVVRNLFFNTPARKKFLKSPMTEASYINDLVLKIALSHPDISFKLIVNNQTRINTAGNGKVKDTIYQLFGRDITNNIIEVNYEENGIKISGFIGKPYVSRGNRGLENYFINNRYIKSNIVNRAIEEGYKTFVMQHKFPFSVLYITLSTDKCDVNVHPTKIEFKYDNEKELFEVVTKCVRNGLLERELIPKPGIDNTPNKSETQNEKATKKPPEPFETNRNNTVISSIINDMVEKKKRELTGRSSSELNTNIQSNIKTNIKTNNNINNNIANNLNDNLNINLNSNLNINSDSNVANNLNSNLNNNISNNLNKNTSNYNALKELVSNEKDSDTTIFDNLLKDSGAVYIPSKENNQSSNTSLDKDTNNSNIHNKDSVVESSHIEENNKEKSHIEQSVLYDKKANKHIIEYNTQTSLFNNQFLSETARIKHRVIGQLFETYWLIEYDDKLYIMDQHAAHEKVKYEELIKNLNEKQVYSQQLLPPIVITVSYAERQIILDNYDLFMNIGYDLEEFGGNEFKINGVPSNLYGIDAKELMLSFVSDLLDNSGYVSKDVFVRRLSTMACKAAIKGNTKISFAEVEQLLELLLTLENPYTCPHGRPTIISISKTELEKKFKRIV